MDSKESVSRSARGQQESFSRVPAMSAASSVAGFEPLPMCLSHFPDSSSLTGGWDPSLGLVSVFSPFPQSLFQSPSSFLLIIVPLSPHPGHVPVAAPWTPSLPVWRAWDGGCRAWGCSRSRNPDQREPGWKDRVFRALFPAQEPLPRASQPGGGDCCPCVLIPVGFLGVATPGAGSTLSNNLEPLGPSHPCFIHELYENCQS